MKARLLEGLACSASPTEQLQKMRRRSPTTRRARRRRVHDAAALDAWRGVDRAKRDEMIDAGASSRRRCGARCRRCLDPRLLRAAAREPAEDRKVRAGGPAVKIVRERWSCASQPEARDSPTTPRAGCQQIFDEGVHRRDVRGRLHRVGERRAQRGATRPAGPPPPPQRHHNGTRRAESTRRAARLVARGGTRTRCCGSSTSVAALGPRGEARRGRRGAARAGFRWHRARSPRCGGGCARSAAAARHPARRARGVARGGGARGAARDCPPRWTAAKERVARIRSLLGDGAPPDPKRLTGDQDKRVREHLRDLLEEPPAVRTRAVLFMLGVLAA